MLVEGGDPSIPSLQVVRTIDDYVPPDNRTLGWAALEWAAGYLRQPDGENAGEPWLFTNEQVRILLRWFEINDRGRFVYRRGVVRRLKGWGLPWQGPPRGSAFAY